MKAGSQSPIADATDRGSQLSAAVHRDAFGKAHHFILSRGDETIALEPGRSWAQADQHKWVTRGCVEEPHTYHVEPDGTVELNGRRIRLLEPNAEAKLVAELGRRQTATSVTAPSARSATALKEKPTAAAVTGSIKVRFKVRLDRLGHLMIDCVHGTEHLETSLRGLQGLIHNGLMLPPKSMHVDPLQHHLEIEGVVYPADEHGARRLEEALNERYAPVLSAEQEGAIEIKENEGAATGFDIHFSFVRAGARFEVRGHLDQEKLDQLCDPQHCDLLNPGIFIRLSPPHLVVRRRQPDGGEHPLPQFPDVEYHQTTGTQLQRLFNHPLVRRSAASPGGRAGMPPSEDAPELLAIHLVRHEGQKSMLWLDCISASGEAPVCRAFTHHNVADLQFAGAFQLQFDVTLSLDNRVLTIANTHTKQAERIILDAFSPDEDLERAGRMLTAALRPVREHKSAKSVPVAEREHPPARETKASAGAEMPATGTLPSPEPAPRPPRPEPPVDPKLLALFHGHDPMHVNGQIFAKLAEDLPIEVAHVCLSLPHVFDDRHFELLCFEEVEISSIFDLRGPNFYGFYLTHLTGGGVDLVFACRGLHLEWTASRCLLQPEAGQEAVEFPGHALRGLAEDADSHLVFIVDPAFKEWVQPFEEACAGAFAHFITIRDYAAAPDSYALVWPLPPE